MLAIIVPTYNGGDVIRRCLVSIREHAPTAQVVVVDNNSEDSTLEIVESEGLAHRVISLKQNMGFAAACNSGAALATTAHALLFLNQDARLLSTVTPGLAVLLDGTTGVVGGMMVDAEGRYRPSAFRFPRLLSVAFKRYSYRRDGEFRYGAFSRDEYDVDYVEGSFLLVRSRVWRALGGMDEKYFMYGEERDFCFRARLAGFSTKFVPAVRYEHEGGYSIDRMPLIITGQLRFLQDHVPLYRRAALRLTL